MMIESVYSSTELAQLERNELSIYLSRNWNDLFRFWHSKRVFFLARVNKSL